MSAISSAVRNAVPPLRAPLPPLSAPAALGGFSLCRSHYLSDQRRDFCGGPRYRWLKWQYGGPDKQWQRAGNRSDRVIYQHSRLMRQKPYWYRGSYCRNDRRRSLSAEDNKKTQDENRSSRWRPMDEWESEAQAELDHMGREFEKFKRAIDADPYGMLFGRHLHPFHIGPKKSPWSTFLSNVLSFDSRGSSAHKREPNVANAESVRSEVDKDAVKEASSASSDRDILFEFDPVSGRMVPKKQPGDRDTNANPRAGDQDAQSVEKPKAGASPTVARSESVPSLDPEQSSETEKVASTPAASEPSSENKSQGTSSPCPRGAADTGRPEANEGAIFYMKAPSQPEKVSSVNKAASSDIRRDQDGQARQTDSTWSQTPRAMFSQFKDYITSKLETETGSNEYPDTSRWPLRVRGQSGSKDGSSVRTDFPRDPEAEELDGLRPGDIRGSFPRREPELKGEKETSTETAKYTVFSGMPNEDSADHLAQQSADQNESLRPGDTFGLQGSAIVSTDVDPKLEDTIRQIYEQRYGKIEPVEEDHAAADQTKAAEQADQAEEPEHMQASSGDDGAVSANPVARDEREDKISRLLTDIEDTNAAMAALLAQVPKADEAAPVQDSPSPSQYRVLAYDCISREVRAASMASACGVPFERLHPADTISRLYNPSKFLPYFPELEAQGYELFSGGPEVLVFKKTKDVVVPSVHSPAQAARLEQESIDQVEASKSESSAASSPGPASAASQPSATPPDSTAPKTRTGSSQTEGKGSQSRGRKAARRMFLGATMTAGTCYALGVVAEYFRTGGQDGLGPRGFTGLEGR